MELRSLETTTQSDDPDQLAYAKKCPPIGDSQLLPQLCPLSDSSVLPFDFGGAVFLHMDGLHTLCMFVQHLNRDHLLS